MKLAFTEAARYAALVMYAWDMCDANLHNVAPKPDPRVAADGWEIVGYITGSDDVVKAGDGIRKQVLRASVDESDRVCYGYLARSKDGIYAAAIRGTDGAEEWFDDFQFFQKTPNAPLKGKVETGFYDIFDSMQYQPSNGAPAVRLSEGIANVTGQNSVVVLGHSLGSALATFLTAELADRPRPANVSACLFASPMPGDSAFADYFASKVKDYCVYNYSEDVVPRTPPIGYSSVPDCTILRQDPTGARIGPDKKCCHHLICYIALLAVAEFKRIVALQGTTPDDCKCAACVTLP